MIMDTSAKTYILGIKGSGGYNCCQKCRSKGEPIRLLGVDKNGRLKTGVRHPDVDAPMREHKDYVDYFKLHPDPHTELTSAAGQKAMSTSNVEPESCTKRKLKKTQNVRQKKKETHHLHPTILSTLLSFNIILGVPLDYMHLVCLGIMKLLLSR